jgi:hypothetical protein
MWWLGLTSGTVMIVATIFLRRFLRSSHSPIDVGTVTENWLAEQRGRKG